MVFCQTSSSEIEIKTNFSFTSQLCCHKQLPTAKCCVGQLEVLDGKWLDKCVFWLQVRYYTRLY